MRRWVALLAVAASLGHARAGRAIPVSRCPAGSLEIPGGWVPVGTTWAQDFDDDERPRTMFMLTHAYCLDRTEVTVEAYGHCVTKGACIDRKPAFAGPTMPMTNVSWHDARRFCAAHKGRLPTEVEWEHAARGTDDRLYPWGSWHPDCALADFWTEMWGSCNGYGPSPVGSLPKGASPYGVLDLTGNVLEWVDDAYDARAWSILETVDPHNDDPAAARHGVRGGSFMYDVVHSLRISDRDGYPSDLRDATLGFRCAYDLPP